MVERRKSADELRDEIRRRALEDLRNQLMSLRCPVSIVENHILQLDKAIIKRAQQKLERQRRLEFD